MEKILLTYKYAFLGQILLFLSFGGYLLTCCQKTPSQNFLKLSSVFLLISYGLLTFCFVISDFSLKAVADSSAFHTPFIYKVSGVWGNAAGSFLLWILFISFTGFMLKSGKAQRLFAFHMVGLMMVQWAVFFPFETMAVIQNGQDLNPLLQDRSMVFHPPILYLGQVFWAYIYFKNFDENFSMQHMQSFTSTGFFILTLGILLGSFWAYYELGWGGVWYWDPVEVISLWAWVLYLYAFHGLMKGVNISFLFSFGWPLILSGMACVRSGLLSSVHSFAENQFFVQNFLIMFFSFIFLSFFCAKKNILESLKNFKRELVSSVSWLSVSILSSAILICLIITVFIPIFKPSLYFSPSFYQHSVWPLMVPLLIIMSLKPYAFYLKYKAYHISFILLFVLLFLFIMDIENLNFISCLTISLCGFGSFCSVFHFFNNRTFSLKKYGMVIGHFGWFLLISSAVIVSFKSTEEILIFENKNDQNACQILDGSILYLTETEENKGENFLGHKIYFTLKNNNKEIVFSPILKYFNQNDIIKSEMSLKSDGFSQHVLVIEKMTPDALKMRYHHKKGILGVWAGGLLLLIGILLLILNIKTHRRG
jgi:c-type cytochrome biogenesis protein CcmF